jgi:hypothetical protein
MHGGIITILYAWAHMCLFYISRRSYYKCTSSRCGAKKHVEKSPDDPEMLSVTYEGAHLHGPQPLFPRRRQWLPVGMGATTTKQQQQQACSASSLSPAALASDDAGGGWPSSSQQLVTSNVQAREPTAAAAAGESETVPGPQTAGHAGDAASTQTHLLLLTADSCDDGSTASMPPPRLAAATFHCDSPPAPTTWSCSVLESILPRIDS